MAGAQIRADFSDVAKKLGIAAESLRTALLVGIKESILLTTRQSFEHQQSPEGKAWAPLSPRYAAAKAKLFRGKPILQARGALLLTLFGEVQGAQAVIGSPMIYAAAHQYGFSKGKRKLPARPFLPTAETAEKEAARVADEILQDALDKTGLT